ncbi:MAG TPA: RNA polymerase factor sigma-54 [Bacteroidia bacterium]|nr:RNA polymerase factor sigma-54 [Bacteroidia bacterium]
MLKQSMQQKLLQKLSPQQIQLMKLLQVPTVALEQRIKEELEINPALEEGPEEDENTPLEDNEEDTGEVENEYDENGDVKEDERGDDFDISEYIQDDEPYYKLNANNTSPDEERNEIPLSVGNTFHELLLSQLGLCDFDDKQYLIATHLIGSLDDDGYLRRDVKALVDDLAFSQNIETTEEEIIEVLKVIQTFDPAGVGARDLQECLLLQLDRKLANGPHVVMARKILSDYMDEFSKKHYEKIEKSLDLTEEDLKLAVHEILHLNPKPGGSFSDEPRSSQHIVPDFIINTTDGILELSLNSRNAPDLRISRQYNEMLETYSKEAKNNKSSRDAVMFVKQKLDAARWFIDAIRQRQITLIRTMDAIMNYQKDYFLEGDEKKLKPMILKDIADIVALDISTISRVANSKYVQTPFGTFLLKSFFSEALSTDSGEEVSSREVKKILSDYIGNEDKKKPLPDEKLMKLLNDKGYNIARRTIAKYREQLGIPVARLRKEL